MSRHEHGAALLEYALLIGLIALVAIGGLSMTGRATAGAFQDAGEALGSSHVVDQSQAATEPRPAEPVAPESPTVESGAVEAPALSLLPEPNGSGGGGGPNLIK